MRGRELDFLVGTQICGAPVEVAATGTGEEVRRIYHHCLRGPGHDGLCDPSTRRLPQGREARLERKVAKLLARDERRRKQIRHLQEICRGHERRRAWMESYIGFRVEYRLRGFWRRLRRYWRFGKSRARRKLAA